MRGTHDLRRTVVSHSQHNLVFVSILETETTRLKLNYWYMSGERKGVALMYSRKPYRWIVEGNSKEDLGLGSLPS